MLGQSLPEVRGGGREMEREIDAGVCLCGTLCVRPFV